MSGRASPQPPRPTRAKAAVLTRAAPGRCANANTQAPRPPRASLRRDETRLALTLLLATQVLLYGGFMVMAAFARATMARPALAGVNLAVVYGFGLILGAIVLAALYTLLCRREPANPEGGPRA